MRTDEILEIIKDSMDGTTTHDYQHTLRVYKLSEQIAIEEKADVELVRVGALLHDIGRSIGEPHTETGAIKAREILESFDYPRALIPLVEGIIRKHGTREADQTRTLEEQIIWDADKIDGFGAIGLARAFHMRGENRMIFHDFNWFHEITELQYNAIGTPSARRIAKQRFQFMEVFFDTLFHEIS